MKRVLGVALTVCVLVLLNLATACAQNHFTRVWSGTPFLAMNVYVSEAKFNGGDLGTNDEIGIFDGTFCVGSAKLTGPIVSGSPLAMVCATDDGTTLEIDGFTQGHTISFKFWISGSSTEVQNGNINKTYNPALSNGIFVSQGSALVQIASPLPVQLVTFKAFSVNGVDVRLEWSTASEITNYGFEIQKASGASMLYESLPNSFVAGHGTTNVSHDYSFMDTHATAGTWYYRLKQMDFDGTTSYSEGLKVEVLTAANEGHIQGSFGLQQNYPNPFNPLTSIRYSLHGKSQVTLSVFNTLGLEMARLVEGEQEAGYHEVRFDASGLASGVYFYRIIAGDNVDTKKLMLLR